LDNVTHTLVGAALGQAGLKRASGLGMATLMIAANLPDVDALAIPFTDSLAFRRGWTHGPLGLAVLPVLLTGAVVGWDRLQARRGKRPAGRAPARPWPVLLLAYAGILTHPFLDWLNTYGIRLLMPFSHEWFYGDAVFIIDPWIWLALGLGLFLARRRERNDRPHAGRPALAALVVATTYIGLMVGGSRVASETAVREIEAQGLGPVERLMAGPVPVNPLRREIIYDRGPSYGFGMLSFVPGPEVLIEPDTLPKHADHPAVRQAVGEPAFQGFLYWSRFPFFEVEEEAGGVRVYVGDLRFSRNARRGWAARSVLVQPESGGHQFE
jgi:inner membrane protein